MKHTTKIRWKGTKKHEAFSVYAGIVVSEARQRISERTPLEAYNELLQLIHKNLRYVCKDDIDVKLHVVAKLFATTFEDWQESKERVINKI